MQVKILVARGKAKLQRVQLELPVIVGRSTDADLTINHPSVSRQHCELFEFDGRVRVRDLGSTNGTRVGGEKVAEAVLRPHDRFSIGPFTLVVDYREASEAAAEQGEEAPGSRLSAADRGLSPLPQSSAAEAEAESDEVSGLSWEEGPVSDESPPARAPQPAPAASPRAKPAAQPSSAASVPPPKKPLASGSKAAAASPPSGGTDPELGIDLDELLEGLEGLDLKDFLKGIE